LTTSFELKKQLENSYANSNEKLAARLLLYLHSFLPQLLNQKLLQILKKNEELQSITILQIC